MSATVSPRDELERRARDRWRTLTITVDPYSAQPDLSKAFQRLSDALRVMAGRMCQGVEGGDEIENRLVRLAVEIEAGRAQERAGRAA